jgi:hypothetical protein
MVDILMRRRQNNPLLTGEAGVKTAVVKGWRCASPTATSGAAAKYSAVAAGYRHAAGRRRHERRV